MKKILTLLLTAMLILPAAMAEEVTLAPDMLALQRANRAMTEKYGHTHETLGLFEVGLIQGGEQYLITYTSGGSVPEALTGKYYALVTGEEVHVVWTHDGVDAALWQSGELASPAWGVKQLTVYLDEHPYTRSTFCDPYEAAALSELEKTVTGAVPFNEVTRDDRSAAEAASKLARKAVQVMYGLSDEVVARLHWPADMTSVAHDPDGHTEWLIVLQDNADVLDPVTYYVTLNGDTGEILRITHFSGGVG